MKPRRLSGPVAWAAAALLAAVPVALLLFHNALARRLYLAGPRWSGLALVLATREQRLDLLEALAARRAPTDPAGALEEVDRLLAADPTARGGRIWLQRGDLLIRLKRPEEARLEAGKAMDGDLVQSALYLLGEASESEGNLERAYAEYGHVAPMGERTLYGRKALQKRAQLREEHPWLDR